jgi:DNA-binding NarL/FixJ family response regulator
MGLLTGRLNGAFRHNYINGSGTWAGRRVALLYTEREIDPGARNFADAQGDRAWDWTARNLACYFPQRFIQTLTRIPLFHPRKPLGDEDELHPEHPAIDRVVSSRKKHSYKLPPPPPDPVPYKWKDGKFMGYDWRSPAHRKLYRKRQRALAKRRIRDRERRRSNPPDSKASGSLQFRGWRWLCPKCGRPCATLYLPIRRHNLLADFGGKFALPAKHQPPSVAPRFACHRCHRVRFFSRLSTEFWNQIVSYLSDGLLYGHEVPRPPWLTKDRKNAFAPRPNAKPSKRRPQVTELLLKGLKIKQIAAELGIAYWTVIEHLKTIYAQHGVRGKLALAQKLGRPIPDDWIPKQERVRRYLKAGWTYEDIAAELKITRHDVAHIAAVLRHQGHNIPRLVRPRRVRVEQ